MWIAKTGDDTWWQLIPREVLQQHGSQISRGNQLAFFLKKYWYSLLKTTRKTPSLKTKRQANLPLTNKNYRVKHIPLVYSHYKLQTATNSAQHDQTRQISAATPLFPVERIKPHKPKNPPETDRFINHNIVLVSLKSFNHVRYILETVQKRNTQYIIRRME